MLKTLLRMNLPTMQKNLEAIIEDLLTEVADKNELNPFDLSLILTRVENQAIGKVYTPENVCIHTLDAAKLLEDLFYIQLEVVPAPLKSLVLMQVKNVNIQEFIIEHLNGMSLMIRYNEDCQLQLFKITSAGTEPIDIDEFFGTLAL